MKRLFIAVSLDETAKTTMVKVLGELRKVPLRAKIEPVDNIHITLKFLGNTDENKINAINETLRIIARRFTPVDIQLKDYGFFPNVRNPRIFWIGITEPVQILIDLQNEIETGMYELGFTKENRPFKAHLTLARIKSSHGVNKLVEKMKELSSIIFSPMQASYFTLYESILRPEGAQYHSINKYYFKEQNPA